MTTGMYWELQEEEKFKLLLQEPTPPGTPIMTFLAEAAIAKIVIKSRITASFIIATPELKWLCWPR
jgi:hypothetical protein